ncbi:Hdc [Bugula neritina]|uniref:Histidine decarboxylase n=1 Tax=Bugula neritina TaxID=10212 RepID=A0A7J7JD44_BUGNE|nr:Hdc [Bugula neritina]
MMPFALIGGEMVEYIANYLETIRERRVYPDVSPGYMSQLIPKDAPHKGESWENIIADVERVVMPGLTHWQSPHMHGYFPATLSYPSLLGDMLADGINALGFTWASSPASTELEVIVTNWLGKAIGLPDEFLHHEMEGDTLGGGGVLQTNASEATFVAMLAARTEAINRERLSNKSAANESDGSIVSRLVAYTSEEVRSYSCMPFRYPYQFSIIL